MNNKINFGNRKFKYKYSVQNSEKSKLRVTQVKRRVYLEMCCKTVEEVWTTTTLDGETQMY